MGVCPILRSNTDSRHLYADVGSLNCCQERSCVTNFPAVRRVLILTMLLNYLATAIKLVTGVLTGSLSILADSLDTLFDGTSNIVGLVGIYIGHRPPDSRHPYGYRKYETLATLGIAFLLFITCWEVAQSALLRFSAPVIPDINLWTAMAVVVSIVIQGATSWYEARAGRLLKSDILIADALYTRGNILVSAAVLVGLVFIRLGHAWVDPLLALIIAVVIARIGIGIVWEAAKVLGDRAPLDAAVIEEIAEAVDGVEFCDHIRSRGAANDISIDLRVHVKPIVSLDRADAIAEAVRRRLMTSLDGVNDVTVRVEPLVPLPGTAAELFPTLRQVAARYPVTVHEVWAKEVEGKLYVEMDIGVDRSLSLKQAHDLVSKIEQESRQLLPSVAGIHTHIEFASNEIVPGRPATPDVVRHVRREVDALTHTLPAVHECHGISVQEYDGRVFIALHCTVDPLLSLEQAHDTASQVEDWLRRHVPAVGGVTVHVEPPGAVDE